LYYNDLSSVYIIPQIVYYTVPKLNTLQSIATVIAFHTFFILKNQLIMIYFTVNRRHMMLDMLYLVYLSYLFQTDDIKIFPT